MLDAPVFAKLRCLAGGPFDSLSSSSKYWSATRSAHCYFCGGCGLAFGSALVPFCTSFPSYVIFTFDPNRL